MPFDVKRYPADWPAVSRAIRERDGHRCKFCGVPNHAYRIYERHGVEEITTDLMRVETASCVDGLKVARIVLTVAHLHDPDPMNCGHDNLAALCQRCHNRHDSRMRQRNAATTRRRKRQQAGQLELAAVTA